MPIIKKDTEVKVTAAKRNITLKDIIASEIKLVDANGEDLSQQFIDSLPAGVITVDLKATFELENEE